MKNCLFRHGKVETMNIKQAIVSGVVGCMVLFASTGAASAEVMATISTIPGFSFPLGYDGLPDFAPPVAVSDTTITRPDPGDPAVNLLLQISLTTAGTLTPIDLFDYRIEIVALPSEAAPVGVAIDRDATMQLSRHSDGTTFGHFPLATDPYIFANINDPGLVAGYHLGTETNTLIASDLPKDQGVTVPVTDSDLPKSLGVMIITIASDAPTGSYRIRDFGGTGFVDLENVGREALTVNSFEFTVVPEPATMSLLVLGGLGVMARRRKR